MALSNSAYSHEDSWISAQPRNARTANHTNRQAVCMPRCGLTKNSMSRWISWQWCDEKYTRIPSAACYIVKALIFGRSGDPIKFFEKFKTWASVSVTEMQLTAMQKDKRLTHSLVPIGGISIWGEISMNDASVAFLLIWRLHLITSSFIFRCTRKLISHPYTLVLYLVRAQLERIYVFVGGRVVMVFDKYYTLCQTDLLSTQYESMRVSWILLWQALDLTVVCSCITMSSSFHAWNKSTVITWLSPKPRYLFFWLRFLQLHRLRLRLFDLLHLIHRDLATKCAGDTHHASCSRVRYLFDLPHFFEKCRQTELLKRTERSMQTSAIVVLRRFWNCAIGLWISIIKGIFILLVIYLLETTFNKNVTQPSLCIGYKLTARWQW